MRLRSLAAGAVLAGIAFVSAFVLAPRPAHAFDLTVALGENGPGGRVALELGPRLALGLGASGMQVWGGSSDSTNWNAQLEVLHRLRAVEAGALVPTLGFAAGGGRAAVVPQGMPGLSVWMCEGRAALGGEYWIDERVALIADAGFGVARFWWRDASGVTREWGLRTAWRLGVTMRF